ncbi:hypothetical protein [Curtobacterium sp. MCBD17_040]|uniref:hypothetical protein n=1 Tax=Curtobacterium sp. MCBD17_040 TaxID=2175674 RepID=UPI000DA86EE4|nr:hypothetical protein [Curtobacterium sp. MCBD17_040]WIB65654.1 hypothetical protein DEI94_16165 [Curtobacterium sp. MCBD17_040]
MPFPRHLPLRRVLIAAAVTATVLAAAATAAPTMAVADPITPTSTASPSPEQPSLTVEVVGTPTADRRVRFVLTVTPAPTDSASTGVTLQIDHEQTYYGGNAGSAAGVINTDIPAQEAGQHTVQASVSYGPNITLSSPVVTFTVGPPLAHIRTTTTVVPPANPIGNVPQQYQVTVTPAPTDGLEVSIVLDDGSTDPGLGNGLLKNGKATITATVLPGQHRLFVEFYGDDTYEPSGLALDRFWAVNTATASETSPSTTPTAAPTRTASTTIPSAAPTAARSTGQLAFTGTSALPELLMGLLLTVAGASVRMARRRRISRHRA